MGKVLEEIRRDGFASWRVLCTCKLANLPLAALQDVGFAGLDADEAGVYPENSFHAFVMAGLERLDKDEDDDDDEDDK